MPGVSQDSLNGPAGHTATGALPLKEVAVALRLTTETLARELAQPGPVAPDWSPFQSRRIAVAVAAMHGVSPLLADALRWRGPDFWNDFLSRQRQHTEARQARIERLLAGIDAGARQAGIALVALKGAALHRLSCYRAGDRPMSDIDLLERIAERLPRNSIDITPDVWPGAVTPGINPYASVDALFAHLLLHAAGNMTVGSLRMLQVHDLALLSSRMARADWDRLVARRVGGVGPWWALPPLALVSRYYSVVPPDVIGALRSHCHWLLRRNARRQTLSDVSSSSLWVRAFPGLAWARGIPGRLACMMRRVWPDRAALSARVNAPTRREVACPGRMETKVAAATDT